MNLARLYCSVSVVLSVPFFQSAESLPQLAVHLVRTLYNGHKKQQNKNRNPEAERNFWDGWKGEREQFSPD